MQRKDEGRPENRNLWSYGQFLEWHILQNTRPEPVAPEIRWTFKTFSDAIDVDDRYLRFWRSGHVLPSERSREHIERALFGTNRAHDHNRMLLRAAYDREKAHAKGNEEQANDLGGPNGLQARITIRDGGPLGAIVFERSAALVRIGRDPTSDIVVPDPAASWEHGQILLRSSVYVYRHLGRNPSLLLRRDGQSLNLSRNESEEVVLRLFDTVVIAPRSLNIHFQLPEDSDDGPTVVLRRP